MAHIVNKTVLMDTISNGIVHFYIESDGSADFVNEPLIDPNTDFDAVPAKEKDGNGLLRIPRLGIEKIMYNLNGIVINFVYEGSPGATGLVLCAGDGNFADFSCIGGIRDITVSNKNNSGGGMQTLVGGNAPTFVGGDIPVNTNFDPKSVLNNRPTLIPQDIPLMNSTQVQNPPMNGTGRLLMTTQGMTLPSLIGGGFANGSMIVVFNKYVA